MVLQLFNTACGALKDRRTEDTIVVIGCGGVDADSNNLNLVWLWNTADNTIKPSEWTCPHIVPDTPPLYGQFVQIDDNWLAFGMHAQAASLFFEKEVSVEIGWNVSNQKVTQN